MPGVRNRGRQPRTTCPKCGRDVAHTCSDYGLVGYGLFRHNNQDGNRCEQRWVPAGWIRQR